MTSGAVSAEVTLLQIRLDGSIAGAVRDPQPFILEACRGTMQLYQEVGFQPPWTGYVAVLQDTAVGGGAFVGPPRDGRVEIAYFMLPEYQSRGYATQVAQRLITIARAADPDLKIFAKTAPEENASTTVLRRLGFAHKGLTEDHEIGDAWAWELDVA